MRVAILGAGPAGSALAIFLARLGAKVTLFDDGRRPELLVGESLVPEIVPILRRLGLEEATKDCGHVKPGVSFIWGPTTRFSFSFARFAPAVFPYAYNIARPQFDDAIVAQAVAAGVDRVVTHAQLEPTRNNGAGAELQLTPETLAAAPALLGRQPDLIVDATGRARQSARVLGIGADVGPRKDVAHFAHFEGFAWPDEPRGQVLIGRGDAGWIWCIPLAERLSIGIVLAPDAAAGLGRTPEERLAQTIVSDAWLQQIAGRATRVTPVATYANYQLISRRACGPGWVAVGDAFGFVDPMLSPGVFLALSSAAAVAVALVPALDGRHPVSPADIVPRLRPYIADHLAALAAWQSLVGQFYDGRMLALMRAGREWMEGGRSRVKLAMQDHIERQIALQASGAATRARYGRGLLNVLGRYGLRGVRPEDMAIR